MITGGSRWQEVDFRLHTPGVHSFAGLNGVNYDSLVDQQKMAEAYPDALVSAGIEIAAITGYNGIRQPWFDLIKSAAVKGSRRHRPSHLRVSEVRLPYRRCLRAVVMA